MRRYSEFKEDCSDTEWTQYKIVVPTEKDRVHIMEAMEHIHMQEELDTNYVTVNQITSEYRPLNYLNDDGSVCEEDCNPKNYNIIVDKELFKKL